MYMCTTFKLEYSDDSLLRHNTADQVIEMMTVHCTMFPVHGVMVINAGWYVPLPDTCTRLQNWLSRLAHTPSSVTWLHTLQADSALVLAAAVCLVLSPHHISLVGLTAGWMVAVWLAWISPIGWCQMTRHLSFLRTCHRNTRLPSIWWELVHTQSVCSNEMNTEYDWDQNLQLSPHGSGQQDNFW